MPDFHSEFSLWLEKADIGYEAVVAKLNQERLWGANPIELRENLRGRNELSKKQKEHICWRAKIFQVPEDVWMQWIKLGDENKDGFCVNTVRKRAHRYNHEKEWERRRLAELGEEGVEIYQGDINEIRSLRLGKAAAVITDPPYHLKTMEVWKRLAFFSEEVLQDGGWLVAMSGNRYLPDVFNSLSVMRYCWTLALSMPGQGNNCFIAPNIAVNTSWKPILIYCKGEPQQWPHGLGDTLISKAPNKEYHDWGQNIDVFKTLVDSFCAAGQLVVDPFLGGGTTAIASQCMGKKRKFEGFDIDISCVEKSRHALKTALENDGLLRGMGNGAE